MPFAIAAAGIGAAGAIGGSLISASAQILANARRRSSRSNAMIAAPIGMRTGSLQAQQDAARVERSGRLPRGQLSISNGYQFSMDQGLRAVDAGAAAKGLLRSGAMAAKRTSGRSRGLRIFNYYNRLFDMSKLGETAAAGGASTAVAAGNSAQGAGNTQADIYNNLGEAAINWSGFAQQSAIPDFGEYVVQRRREHPGRQRKSQHTVYLRRRESLLMSGQAVLNPPPLNQLYDAASGATFLKNQEAQTVARNDIAMTRAPRCSTCPKRTAAALIRALSLNLRANGFGQHALDLSRLRATALVQRGMVVGTVSIWVADGAGAWRTLKARRRGWRTAAPGGGGGAETEHGEQRRWGYARRGDGRPDSRARRCAGADQAQDAPDGAASRNALHESKAQSVHRRGRQGASHGIFSMERRSARGVQGG